MLEFTNKLIYILHGQQILLLLVYNFHKKVQNKTSVKSYIIVLLLGQSKNQNKTIDKKYIIVTLGTTRNIQLSCRRNKRKCIKPTKISSK